MCLLSEVNQSGASCLASRMSFQLSHCLQLKLFECMNLCECQPSRWAISPGSCFYSIQVRELCHQEKGLLRNKWEFWPLQACWSKLEVFCQMGWWASSAPLRPGSLHSIPFRWQPWSHLNQDPHYSLLRLPLRYSPYSLKLSASQPSKDFGVWSIDGWLEVLIHPLVLFTKRLWNSVKRFQEEITWPT